MLTSAEVNRIKTRITNSLKASAGVSPARVRTLLPIKSLQGKLYEADVLATICEKLVKEERLTITLAGGSTLMLKQKGGAIDRKCPYFQVWKGSILFGEIFTDIYFDTLSYQLKGSLKSKDKGDYHELDIALVKPNLSGHPKHSDLILAVECKNTSIQKSIIREVLGFRRELSFYPTTAKPTNFTTWPTTSINSDPNSVHMLYCSDRRVSRYTSNCLKFGIILEYHKM